MGALDEPVFQPAVLGVRPSHHVTAACENANKDQLSQSRRRAQLMHRIVS